MSSNSSKNNPDFTFQCSPDICKSYGQQIGMFDKPSNGDDSDLSNTQRNIQKLILKNKSELSYGPQCGTEEIKKNLNVDKSYIDSSPQQINPFLQSEESKKSTESRLTIKPQQPYYQKSHCIQNYLRMLELKTIKGDQNSVQSQQSEVDSSKNQKLKIISIHKIVQTITNCDLESNISTQNNNQDQDQNHNYCTEFKDNSSDIYEIFKQQYSIICRICKKEGFKTENKEYKVINPCSCSGPNYWVHNTCLEDEIRKNICDLAENQNQNISCKICMTAYSLSLFKYRNWSRYRELMPCLVFLLALIGLMLYFFVQLMQEINKQSISIPKALTNFYIVVFIIIICIVIVFLSLKMLEQVKLKINNHQKNLQSEQNEQIQEIQSIIKYLKETNGQFI